MFGQLKTDYINPMFSAIIVVSVSFIIFQLVLIFLFNLISFIISKSKKTSISQKEFFDQWLKNNNYSRNISLDYSNKQTYNNFYSYSLEDKKLYMPKKYENKNSVFNIMQLVISLECVIDIREKSKKLFNKIVSLNIITLVSSILCISNYIFSIFFELYSFSDAGAKAITTTYLVIAIFCLLLTTFSWIFWANSTDKFANNIKITTSQYLNEKEAKTVNRLIGMKSLLPFSFNSLFFIKR